MRNNLLTMIGVSRCGSLDEIIVEAQKIEEILYQRSKQQRQANNIKQETLPYNTTATSVYDDEHGEVQAVSAYQTNRYSNSYTRKNYNTQNSVSDRNSPTYTNYSAYSTTNRRYAQPLDEIKCYACGMKGHIRRNCPGQYSSYQQQSRNTSKNGNGAQVGRDYDAPK